MTLSALLTSNPPPQLQIFIFLFSLYLVAIGQGGHKPCVQAFGADQFDEHNPDDREAKSSFFNWWYFGISVGANSAILIVIYIQDNLNWALGFGIPCALMVVALCVFLLGTKTYRYPGRRNDRNPFARIGLVFVVAFKNRKAACNSMMPGEDRAQSSQQFRFLHKALVSTATDDSLLEDGKLCSVNDVEEAKALLRLVPIWTTCLVYAIVFAQSSTFFTKQGATMDRAITPSISIPAASLQVFIGIAIIIFIPIYDRVVVPVTRSLTHNPSGITLLQRIGTGMFLSTLSMVAAALVETKRLETAKEYGLIDNPNATIPMSVWWLIPQYVLLGTADVFTIVGLQEFFYDQIPNELKSVGLSLYLSILGVGSFLSSILVSLINNATSGESRDSSWFADNLNRAHLDYFYWLLAALSALGLAAYLYFAKSYIYNNRKCEYLHCNTIVN